MSVASLRAYGLNDDLLDELALTRISGLTFAPEAGTQRMRDVVNKNVTEAHVEDSARRVFARGWHRLKLYFMIGLPTEEDDDVRGIVETGLRMLRIGRELVGDRAEVTVSVQLARAQAAHAAAVVRARSDRRDRAQAGDPAPRPRATTGVAPQASRQRHLVRRGRARARRSPARRRDRVRVARRRALRRLGRVFELERWQRALDAHGVDIARVHRHAAGHRAAAVGSPRRRARGRLLARRVPQGAQGPRVAAVRQGRRHADPPHEPRRRGARSAQAGLLRLRRRVRSVEDARPTGWSRCARSARPSDRRRARRRSDAGRRAHRRFRARRWLAGGARAPARAERAERVRLAGHIGAGAPYTTYRMRFAKVGRAAFLGHLDLVRLLARTLRRAELPLAMTRGFSPKPRFAFGPALGLGVPSSGRARRHRSRARRHGVEPLAPADVRERLAAVCPPAWKSRAARSCGSPGIRSRKAPRSRPRQADRGGRHRDPARAPTAWRTTPRGSSESAAAFFAKPSIVIARGEKTIDVRRSSRKLDVLADDAAAKLCGALDWPETPAPISRPRARDVGRLGQAERAREGARRVGRRRSARRSRAGGTARRRGARARVERRLARYRVI